MTSIHYINLSQYGGAAKSFMEPRKSNPTKLKVSNTKEARIAAGAEIERLDQEIANLLNVQYQTTLLIFRDNKEVYRSVGETSKDLIYKAIESSI